jgi:hypothetical protein
MQNGTRNKFLAVQTSAEDLLPRIALTTAPAPNPFDTKKRALLHPESCAADGGGISFIGLRGGPFPCVSRPD